MRIMLAPMEGVVDHTLRDMLTQIGGIDRCVTEFVRVTRTRLPARVFKRYCPELLHEGELKGKTRSGTPVYIQLLGGQPNAMAENAAVAAQLGAPGIDINFGCPAKTVNRNDGGSVLLREPQRVHDIVNSVRGAVPPGIPVTAKIRLGYQDDSQLEDICQGIFTAGANELTIHARTKEQGYKPPAYWASIARVRAISPIPVIANGEIWTPEDAANCLQQSHCQDLMLGRGLLACPDLAVQIRQQQLRQLQGMHIGQQKKVLDWQDILQLLLQFCDMTEAHYEAKYVGNRVKQWLAYLRQHYAQGHLVFEQIKRLRWPDEIHAVLQRQLQADNKDAIRYANQTG